MVDSMVVIFVIAAVVALYAEYSAGIFLAALIAAALWIGRPDRRRTALLGALAFATLAPWIPQIIRAQNQVGKTKLHPMFATPSLSGFRNTVVLLAFGEGGGTSSSVGRWLELLAILTLACAGAIVLRGSWDRTNSAHRRAIMLLAITAGLTLIGQALAPLVGLDVFTQRYMTIMIALAPALSAAALVAARRRSLVVLATTLLLGLHDRRVPEGLARGAAAAAA